MARKTVYAPPSVKLGLTLVSARGGPVIYELQPGSPLEGQVRVGWRLVAIGCSLAAATVGLAAVSRAAHLGWLGWAWAWALLSLVFCGICAMYVRCICLHIHLLSAGQTTIDYLHPTENGDGAELGEECVGLAAPKRRDARERQEAIFGLHRSCQWNCAATVWRVAVRWYVASPWFRAVVWALRVY